MILLYKVLTSLIWIFCVVLFFKYNRKNLLTVSSFVILSITVIFYIPLVFEMYEWSNDSGFLAILFSGFLGVLFAILLYERILVNKKSKIGLAFGKFHFFSNNYETVFTEKTGVILLLTSFVLLYYAANLILALKSYSWNIVALILRDRIGLYSSSVTSIEGIEDAIRPLALILTVYYLERHKKTGIIIWLAILSFKLAILHGRFEIIMHCLLLVLYYNYYIKRIKLSAIVTLLVVSIGFLSIANYARTGMFTEAGSFNFDALLPKNAINQLFRASSSTTNIFYLVYERGIPCDWFRQYYYYLPISFIPRFLWSGKPIVSYFWRLTKAIYGVYPFEGNSRVPVETSTLWGEAYHEGGIVNVFFITLIYMGVLNIFLRFIKKYKYTDFIVYTMMISIPMDIRGGFHSVLMTWFEILIPIIVMHALGLYKQRRVICNEGIARICS